MRPILVAILTFVIPTSAATSALVPVFVSDLLPPNANGCRGSVTAFDACSTFVALERECSGKTVSPGRLSCVCQQDKLNALRSCQNEARICLQSPLLDADFEHGIEEWHSSCDSHLGTSTITVPPLVTLSTTWDPEGDCAKYAVVCESALYETKHCSYSVTGALDFVSCVCQPKITSLYSSCLYDGSIECLGENAALSHIIGYDICPHFQSGTAEPSVVSAALTVFPWSSDEGTPQSMPTVTAA